MRKSPDQTQHEKANAGISPDEYRRVRLTVSCRDCDSIPKVSNAGAVVEMNGERIQVMHNGVRFIEGRYCGAWMTEIIRQLKGHHEPQEELAFHLIVERLRNDMRDPVMLELGAFWSYYSLWFLDRISTGTAFLIEPDPNNLEVGRKNFALNGRVGTFLQAAIGANSAPPSMFRCESDGVSRLIPTESLPSLFGRFGLSRADIVLADIQGYETVLLEGAAQLLSDKRVRFLVISTHHQLASGDPITHQRCLELLKSLGAHIIAEHSVSESYSGDGLIAVSFDVRDRDLVAKISYARARDSVFGEVELELARSEEQLRLTKRQLEAELGRIKNSVTFRSMRKFAPIVDRCFPVGTYRGTLLLYARRKLQTYLS